jgi:glycosyltransferase involved in cell wall biosynthesis
VEVVGFVDDERSEIAGAAALLVPLRYGGGSRLKILTAMSMSRPIVSTTIGAEGIACESGHDLILADEPRAFAQAVIRVCSDEAFRQCLGSNARRRATGTYDWGVIGARMRDEYASLLR